MTSSLEARISDPLWLMARQWQFGEFQGEDCGSPVKAELAGYFSHINYLNAGAPYARPAEPYSARTQPLETRVEQESALQSDEPQLKLRADLGRQWLALLGKDLSVRYRELFFKEYPLPLLPTDADEAAQRAYRLLAGRVLDGYALYTRLVPWKGTLWIGTKIPPFDQIQTQDQGAVMAAALRWRTWCATRIRAQAAPAWVPAKQEYEFTAVASGKKGEVLLHAGEHRGERLDWYAFDAAKSKTGPCGKPQAEELFERAVIPAPVRFSGMPSTRWWEFEDARVSFGSVETGPEDLGKLLLMEFALAYGNDFFLIPVSMEVGSLCCLDSFRVTNTFGEVINIPPASSVDGPKGTWRMFVQTPETKKAPDTSRLFFLAPTLGPLLEGKPLEEVRLMRDEMANLGWAIERSVMGASGEMLDRYEAYQEKRRRATGGQMPAPPAYTAALEYQLAGEVPEYWLPLIPQPTGNGARSMELKLGGLTSPWGRLLQPKNAWVLHEEELPRAGAQITRGYQYSRWTDGSTHLWVGRNKTVGRGEGSSGLVFDQVKPKTTP
jgi:hypothetical protein